MQQYEYISCLTNETINQKKLLMRGLVVILMCVMIVTTSGCLKKEGGCTYKNENKVAPASEEQALLNYLTANNISATKHGSNMYYEVVTPGTGAVPGLCSRVLIKYAGKLTNGSQFDSNNDGVVFTLGSLIEGWKIGLPLIKAGGEIRLYIPPSLGYGSADVKNNGVIIIPANSILIFTITLLDVQ